MYSLTRILNAVNVNIKAAVKLLYLSLLTVVQGTIELFTDFKKYKSLSFKNEYFKIYWIYYKILNTKFKTNANTPERIIVWEL